MPSARQDVRQQIEDAAANDPELAALLAQYYGARRAERQSLVRSAASPGAWVNRIMGGEEVLRRPELATGLTPAESAVIRQQYVDMLGDIDDKQAKAVNDMLDRSKSMTEKAIDANNEFLGVLRQMIQAHEGVQKSSIDARASVDVERIKALEVSLTEYNKTLNMSNMSLAKDEHQKAISKISGLNLDQGASFNDFVATLNSALESADADERARLLAAANTVVLEKLNMSMSDFLAKNAPSSAPAGQLAKVKTIQDALAQVAPSVLDTEAARKKAEAVMEAAAPALLSLQGGRAHEGVAGMIDLWHAKFGMMDILGDPEAAAALGIMSPEDAVKFVEEQMGGMFDQRRRQVELELERMDQPIGAQTAEQLRADVASRLKDVKSAETPEGGPAIRQRRLTNIAADVARERTQGNADDFAIAERAAHARKEGQEIRPHPLAKALPSVARPESEESATDTAPSDEPTTPRLGPAPSTQEAGKLAQTMARNASDPQALLARRAEARNKAQEERMSRLLAALRGEGGGGVGV